MHETAAAAEGREHPNRAAVPIAQAVRRLRAERSWTLDDLAAHSGVSRRLIVQIEQAQANPSVGTLLRLADAFEVTLSQVLPAEPAASAGVRPGAEALNLWTGPRGGEGWLLVSRGPLELWSFTVKPGESLESEPHSTGCIELLTVTSGRLQLDVGSETFILGTGDSAWFAADVDHAYRNRTRSASQFTLAVLDR
jgi:transcriptional regulator with XRE-family HTH domain